MQARGGVADTLTEVSEFYSAAGPLSRRLADDSLAHWFAHLADQASTLDDWRLTPAHFTLPGDVTGVLSRTTCGIFTWKNLVGRMLALWSMSQRRLLCLCDRCRGLIVQAMNRHVMVC